MKSLSKITLVATLFALIMSCGNKEQEKKIAELESRIDELTAGSTSAPAPVPEPVVEEKPEGPLPVFEFAETEYDFGTIDEGDEVEHVFKFTNTGEVPLIIQNATGSCGCTVPTWSKEPIPVGGEGSITAKFNSAGKPNAQNKTVNIIANTWPKQTRLTIKAMVTPAPEDKTASAENGPVK